MVSPDYFTIFKRNMLLCLCINMQNRMRYVDSEVGDDAASNIDAVVFFMPARLGDPIKIDDAVELFPVGERYRQQG